MAFESKTGLGVSSQYGVRSTGGNAGTEHRKDSKVRLVIQLTGRSINEGFLPPVVVPVGARFESARLRVDEAFALSGTTPTVRIGSEGSIATNGVVLTEAELENVGTKAPASTGAGTWSFSSSTGVTAAAKVKFDLGGTSPVVSPTQGKATLVLEYTNLAK